MPFIRGKYYMNPVAGEAIEAARQAEEPLLANGPSANEDRSDQSDPDNRAGTKPVRRIEIEVAELVPSHSGRATKGYVARLHRQGAAGSEDEQGSDTAPAQNHVFYDQGQLLDFLQNELAKNGTCR